MAQEEIISKLQKAIIEGDQEMASKSAQQALETRMDVMEAINGAVEALQVLGDKFERMEAFLPDLALGGDAMKACMAILLRNIRPEKMAEISPGKVVIGTVQGDIHDIGKNLVSAMLSVSMFEVYDVGENIPAKQFAKKAEEVGAKAIALSALLTTTAYYQEDVIRYLEDAGIREKYYVVVGGGVVTPEWAAQIGADGYGRLCTDAPKILKQLIAQGKTPPLPEPLIIRN